MSRPAVVLPGINELFPEHLLRVAPDTLHFDQHPVSPGWRKQTGKPSRSSQSTALALNERRPTLSSGEPASYPYGQQANTPHSLADARPSSRGRRSKRSGSLVYSFDVLRSDPSNSSLEHIASSVTYPNRGGPTTQVGIANGSAPAFRVDLPSVPGPSSWASGARHEGSLPSSANMHGSSAPAEQFLPSYPAYSTVLSFPSSKIEGPLPSPGRGHSPTDSCNASDAGDLSGEDDGKKHVCPTCLKRFNRPSSLRIHVNTHTGATPFRCPWPNCGREFNVNSNMRRHYRNHSAPGVPRAQAKDPRRRRRRGPPGGFVFLDGSVSNAPEGRSPYLPSPPFSSLSISENSEDEDGSDSMDEEMDELRDSPYATSPMATSAARDHLQYRTFHTSDMPRKGWNAYSQSPSPSPPPPSPFTQYSPASYVRSFPAAYERPTLHRMSSSRCHLKREPVSLAI